MEGKTLSKKEQRPANRRLTQWRVIPLKRNRLWLIEHSTSHQLLW